MPGEINEIIVKNKHKWTSRLLSLHPIWFWKKKLKCETNCPTERWKNIKDSQSCGFSINWIGKWEWCQKNSFGKSLQFLECFDEKSHWYAVSTEEKPYLLMPDFNWINYHFETGKCFLTTLCHVKWTLPVWVVFAKEYISASNSRKRLSINSTPQSLDWDKKFQWNIYLGMQYRRNETTHNKTRYDIFERNII